MILEFDTYNGPKEGQFNKYFYISFELLIKLYVADIR